MSRDQLDLLLDLPADSLRGLALALKSGPLSLGMTRGAIEQFVGPKVSQVAALFKRLSKEGCTKDVIAEICQAHANIREKIEAERSSLLLVLGGPDVSGVPVVDTPTMARSLFAEAREDVIIATYVIYTPAEFFKPLADMFDSVDGFRVRIIVDLSPERKSKEEPLPIVENRFKRRFLDKCWPGKKEPELWFDPRPFADGTNEGGVMHAKTLIIDKTATLITSANFTEAAHQRNIEAGVLLRNSHEVTRLRRYFEGLMECGHLKIIV